ncbi:flagellar basal-body rod protein FlgB [Peptoclostridium litorale DSM 5388]|uniref:Flagellar basal body rod protein FlgB n=1 Tax=Peptoclostridium litorale DSM 5388 TaxID=1121324 RepID=A0A069RDR0_PEPLI|nr:flagellar basal body rod protein FlgB [Peptoclostridium litorale]KDR95156.1 flagellar basal body rod protein FlgB [Peptoclostridium litorale DSM 5388]SIN74109.1 flagellar basal-body rod protein FlgB [Peptoclostridium litorale DSM 5388]
MNGKSLSILSNALDYYWNRNKLINSNIANVNTPNYKRKDVSFAKVLEKTDNGTIEGYVTDKKHIRINDVEPSKIYENNSSDSVKTRMDGNNVDLDIENAELAKNTIGYNTTVDQITNHFRRMKSVIGEGRR